MQIVQTYRILLLPSKNSFPSIFSFPVFHILCPDFIRYNQQAGVDLDETFSPVIKPITIRTILSLTLYHGWAIHRLNVKDIYLSS